MAEVFIIAIIFGGIFVAPLAIVCGTILFAMRIRHGGGSGGDRKSQAREAEMIQEIYRGLSKMENRIEVLETILIDYRGKELADEKNGR